MKNVDKKWLIAGIALDTAGIALIIASFSAPGPLLAAGLGLMLAGGLAVVKAVARAAPAADADEKTAAANRKAWKPEPELDQLPPRRVRLAPAARVILLAWLALLGAAGFVGYDRIGRLNPPPPSQGLLDSEGVHTEGVIHRRETRLNGAGEPVYYLYYNFQDQTGAGVRSSIVVGKSLFDEYVEGRKVEVVYLPGEALAHYLPELHQPAYAARGLLMAGVVAFFLVYLLESKRRRHHALATEGRPVAGTVESLRRRGAAKVYTVRYRAQGGDYLLKVTERNQNRKAGDAVTVLYDPTDPKEAELYRVCLYRVV